MYMTTIVSFFENQVKEEAEITRKFLRIIPEDKYDWKPHPKSMSLRVLATHIAELPGWVPLGINTSVLDFAAGDYQPAQVHNNRELQAVFEENQQQALEGLAKTNDEFLQNEWTMRNGEQVYMTIRKEDLIRIAMSQTIHHRAQLGVFLRLLDVPIPGSYGPSADEMGF
jgi:uncharacterized damage-inducible protein DinB